jgi:hypothetical protein
LSKQITQEMFIARCRKVHGDRYGYESVIYTKMKAAIKVRCKIHGIFSTSAEHHSKGTNCIRCTQAEGGQRKRDLSERTFARRAIKKHGNKYDYSKLVYKGDKVHAEIICPKHGSFWQSPGNHLTGFGCKHCGREKTEASRKLSATDFFRRCKEVHAGKYEYRNMIYENPEDILKLECPTHGPFKIKARNHLWIAQGCRKCGIISTGVLRTVGWDQFSSLAKKVHKGLYEYDADSYRSLTSKLRAKCSLHGWFLQQGNKHLAGQGCPRCARELMIGKWKSSTLPKKIRNAPCSFYYLKISSKDEVFYKIGISNDTDRRIRTLKKESKCKIEVLWIKKSTYYRAMLLEERIKRKHKSSRYLPKADFHGFSECYHVDVLKMDKSAANRVLGGSKVRK